MSGGSLRLRLLLAAGSFIIAALILSGLGLMVLFERHVERWIDSELGTHLDQLIAGLDTGADGALEVARPPNDPRFEQPLSGLYWEVAVEPDGPVMRSRSLWDYEIILPSEDAVDDAVNHHRVEGPDGQTLYLLQRRVELPQRLGAKMVRAAIGLDTAEVRAAVWRFGRALAPFLLLLGVLLTLAAWAQVAVGLKPLKGMRQKLEAIRQNELRRLGTGYPDEVQPLATEIDSLLDQRDRQIEKARARATDLAHALKTPLQVLHGDAEQLKAKGEIELGQAIEGLSRDMQGHVERQLARARMGNDINATTNVSKTAGRVVRVMKRTPDGKRLNWWIEIPTTINARIDPEDFAEALGNVVENAARHAKARVMISGNRETDFVSISVTDDGPGIPRERQPDMLVRGARLDTSGPGAGLGLAIVTDIADAWGGTLSFETLDEGFRAELRLPPAQATRTKRKAQSA
jgi:signal transduction histidine kinase